MNKELHALRTILWVHEDLLYSTMERTPFPGALLSGQGMQRFKTSCSSASLLVKVQRHSLRLCQRFTRHSNMGEDVANIEEL